MATKYTSRSPDVDESAGLREVAAYLEGVVDAVGRLEVAASASDPLPLLATDDWLSPPRGGSRMLDLEAASPDVGTASTNARGGSRVLDLETLVHAEPALASIVPRWDGLAPMLDLTLQLEAPDVAFWAASNDAVTMARGGTRELVLDDGEPETWSDDAPGVQSLWPASDEERVSGFRFHVAPLRYEGTGTDDE